MPTMVGAAVYSGYKYRDLFQAADLPVFAIGFVTSFIFAMIAVRALLSFIGKHSYAVICLVPHRLWPADSGHLAVAVD